MDSVPQGRPPCNTDSIIHLLNYRQSEYILQMLRCRGRLATGLRWEKAAQYSGHHTMLALESCRSVVRDCRSLLCISLLKGLGLICVSRFNDATKDFGVRPQCFLNSRCRCAPLMPRSRAEASTVHGVPLFSAATIRFLR